MRVSIQGVKGSFHEEATLKYFKGEELEILECKTFKAMVEELAEGNVDFGVMAIENSIAGSLLENYSLMREYHLRVVGETHLHINMNLMMLPGGDIKDIKEIHSHPIALKQCGEFIYRNYSEAKLLEKSDTAGAANELVQSGRMDVATIGNVRTSEIYGLEIKEKGIETNKKNYTRFLVLSKVGNPIDNTNKSSICIECSHQHGSLAKVLNIFSEYGINLTRIQSIPILGKPNEYSFHIDLEYSSVESYERAIHLTLKSVSSLAILGEYIKSELHNC